MFSAKLRSFVCSEILGGIWRRVFSAIFLQWHDGDGVSVARDGQQTGQSGGGVRGVAGGGSWRVLGDGDGDRGWMVLCSPDVPCVTSGAVAGAAVLHW